jgi:predicted helicase
MSPLHDILESFRTAAKTERKKGKYFGQLTQLHFTYERQCFQAAKDSGVASGANDWAVKTMCNPRYSTELFQRVNTVSLEAMKFVRGLPPLHFYSKA